MTLLRIAVVFVFWLACGAATALADEAPVYHAVLRDRHESWFVGPVTLEGLKDPWLMETDDFKIVESVGNQPIDLRVADAGLRLRATNVLYHLSRAKRYFARTLGLASVLAQPQITVRLDITNGYSNLGHFKNANLAPSYNNALSISAGTGLAGSGVAPWGNEIWFRPAKKIPTRDVLAALAADPLDPTIRGIRRLFYPFELNLAVSNIAVTLLYENSTATANTWLSLFLGQAATIAVVEVSMELMRHLNRWLLPHDYYIDTAMIPAVIMHEYSHQALSDAITVEAWTPVIEGFADYFAAEISGHPQIAAKIKRYSTAEYKNGKQHKLFELKNERLPTADFVLSLLWGLRDTLGRDVANQLVLDARHEITPASDIRTGLLRSLLDSCSRVCPDAFVDSQKLYKYFGDRGL